MSVININNDFEDIKNYKNQIEIIIKTIKNKIDILKSIYKEYHDKQNIFNGDKSSLDSLNNQLFLINTENNNYKNILSIFLNKIYGEYYNLFKNLSKFIKPFIENKIIELQITVNYPIYKVLDFNEVYEFTFIENINNDINNIINCLLIHIANEKEEIKYDEFQRDKGIHLNNFVTEKKCNINVIEEKIKFYNNIFCTYKILQNKFLKRLLLKLQILFYQLEFDINISNDNYNDVNKIKNLTEFFGEKNIFIDKKFEENIFSKIKDLDNNIFLRENTTNDNVNDSDNGNGNGNGNDNGNDNNNDNANDNDNDNGNDGKNTNNDNTRNFYKFKFIKYKMSILLIPCFFLSYYYIKQYKIIEKFEERNIFDLINIF